MVLNMIKKIGKRVHCNQMPSQSTYDGKGKGILCACVRLLLHGCDAVMFSCGSVR